MKYASPLESGWQQRRDSAFVRDKRVPIGSVPFGDSCSVGQFRATGILKCLLPVLGTYSVLPYA